MTARCFCNRLIGLNALRIIAVSVSVKYNTGSRFYLYKKENWTSDLNLYLYPGYKWFMRIKHVEIVFFNIISFTSSG